MNNSIWEKFDEEFLVLGMFQQNSPKNTKKVEAFFREEILVLMNECYKDAIDIAEGAKWGGKKELEKAHDKEIDLIIELIQSKIK